LRRRTGRKEKMKRSSPPWSSGTQFLPSGTMPLFLFFTLRRRRPPPPPPSWGGSLRSTARPVVASTRKFRKTFSTATSE